MKGVIIDRQTGDLAIAGGALVIGEADAQRVEMIVALTQGDLKSSPLTGVGIGRSRGGATGRFVERDIRVQLEADGFKISRLTVGEQGITIEGEY
jgi:hypothetical protein